MITITKALIARNILEAYYDDCGLNPQQLERNENPIDSPKRKESFLKFLENYFQMNISEMALVQATTMRELISAISNALPDDKLILYYQIMTLYKVMLSQARDEMDQWHRTYIQLTRKLQKDVNEIEDFVLDILDEA